MSDSDHTPMEYEDSLIARTALEVIGLLRGGEVSGHELLDVLERRISEVEPAVGAFTTLCFERARQQADRLVSLPVEDRGLLCGLPVPIKDLTDVAGVRTSHGSPIYADHVPQRSDLLVERLELEGAVIYAKSNTPEFGAGAQTFNEVFPPTRNPWDTRLSVAGSSGGAAAALASGTAWLAQGSDMGGSLRNPASFCGVVGLRPSPGRVATGPSGTPFQVLSVKGPMARDVRDCALLLDAMTGWHPADPLSLRKPEAPFRDALGSAPPPRRVAFSRDLGLTPVDPEVADLCQSAARVLEGAGIAVEEAHPELGDAHEVFQTLRALDFAAGLGSLLAEHRARLKPEIVWNIEKGLALSAEDIAAAECRRGELYHRAVAFFETYDLLLTPATIVPPFPVEERYPTACQGHAFETYIDWLAIAYAITLTSCPAISIPCGFTRAGHLPVGLQIVGPPRGEAPLLAGAFLMEQLLGLGPITPIEPKVTH
jgi:amidase